MLLDEFKQVRHAGAVSSGAALDLDLARRFFASLGQNVPRASFELSSAAMRGSGTGVSTAALLALATTVGVQATPDALARACLAAEGAVDPLMLPHADQVLWASREARSVRRLPTVSAFEVLGGFFGAPERTRGEDQDFPDISDLVVDWERARDAAAQARIASQSAERTTALRGPGDDPMAALARTLGALGHIRAHTGSARGLLFPADGSPAKAEDAMREAGLEQIVRFRSGASK